MFTVLDVSRWQGRIDWDTVKASGRVHGVMLRALGSRNGTPYIDPMFETNYSACTRLGIPVGIYYYSCDVTAPQRDAELALLHDALRGKRLQLPAAIDVEDARLRALTPDALSALVAGAARQLEHWGLYAMVYTYTHFADTALHMDTLAPFDLWLADYRGKLWGDRIFEKCGIRRDEGGDGGKTLEIRGKRRLSARDGGANYQQS